jgi:hypothetical protein
MIGIAARGPRPFFLPLHAEWGLLASAAKRMGNPLQKAVCRADLNTPAAVSRARIAELASSTEGPA